jgi:type I restriction enzyme S subunit
LAHNYPLGWTVKSLKTFAERVERRVSGAPEHVLMIASRTGFIPQADKYDRFMAGRSVEKYIDLHCGEFAYNKGNSLSYPCGCVYRLQGYHSAAVPFVYFCFAVNEEAAEPSYLEQFFAGGGLNTQLKGRINSGVRNNGLLNIRADEFFSCEVPLPPLPEQRKIAAILTSVDNAIEDTQAVIYQLQAVKKAMMADLLTRGIPGRHKKFKQTEIGEVPEAWEVMRMEALSTPRGMVGGPFGSDLTAMDYVKQACVPVIRGGNISMGHFHDMEFVYVSSEKANALSRNSARRGDVVMTQRGASLGETALVPSNSLHAFYIISQTMMRMTPDLKRVAPRFLLHYICSPAAQTWLHNHQIATGQPHLNLGIFRDMPAILPDPAEQEQIATTLDRLDDVANCNGTELDQLRHLKSALMSVLLTGEVRVRVDEEVAA